MSGFASPTVRALGVLVAFASLAGAQEKECQVNEGRPTAVGRATLAIQVASNATDPNTAARQLTSAVRTLTNNDAASMDNQAGRNFVLGKALVLWSMQPKVELVTRRGPLGYSSDPDSLIDLAAAIDSAFKVVETSNPECVAETARWRGQKGWINLVNTAIQQMNADSADAAEVSARRAIVLNPWAPYGYVVLANVMQRKNPAAAFALYRQSVEVASRDTSYDEVRRQSLVYLGTLAADSAEMSVDTAVTRGYVTTALDAFGQVLKDPGAKDFVANARAGMCRIAVITGDTASLRTTYKEPLAGPAAFSYAELMNAGVCLARAEMIPEARTLFQAAYEKNPFHRDALSNLAIMLLREEKEEQAIPLASRLVMVEPNNPENIQLLVLGYAGIAKRAREARLASTPKQAKGAAKTSGPKLSAAALDSLFRIEKAYSDSAVVTNARKENLPYRVTLNDFSVSDARASVSGSITNNGTVAKPITLKVDFLDRNGNVVATREAETLTIAGGESARFSVQAEPGAEIAAFRYVELK